MEKCKNEQQEKIFVYIYECRKARKIIKQKIQRESRKKHIKIASKNIKIYTFMLLEWGGNCERILYCVVV